jgi:lysophospholipase L1-like esterase
MSSEPVLAPETAFLIDFNVHQVPAALGLEVPPAAAAAMLGITEAQFSHYVSGIEAGVARLASNLHAEPECAAAIVHLPVPPGGTVLAIGDSITTYRCSYARLLAALLALGRPADGIRFVNAGQSGYTSTHALEVTYTQFLALQPDLVFIMYGANDCKRFGSPQTRALVPLDAYRANMTAIIGAYQAHTHARLVLLGPTPVAEGIANRCPDFAAMRMTWDNADILAYTNAVGVLAAEHGLLFVDMVHAFGPDPDPALYLPDGLHPGPEGQLLILREVLRALARPTKPANQQILKPEA